MASLATKYRPRKFDQVIEQALVVSLVKTMCESETLPNRNFLFIGSAGVGKAQPLDSNVLTPQGFIKMRDITVGTKVITGQGNLGTVSGIYPQGIRPVYEIVLQDKTKIRVSDEHLNVVYRYNENKKCRQDYCLTTLELIDLFKESKFKLRIDVPCINQFYSESSNLPIDPYLLGTLIGDGSLSGNFAFSNNEPDVIEKVDSILRRDWNSTLVKCSGDNVDYSITRINRPNRRYTFFYKNNTYSCDEIVKELVKDGYPHIDSDTIRKICLGEAKNYNKKYPELQSLISFEVDPDYVDQLQGVPLRNALKKLNLLVKSIDKHIPKEYLLASFDVRLKLLQGLYDTDGYTDKSGTVSFSTCSPQLSEDFAFLVRSLGIRDTVSASASSYTNNGKKIVTGTTCYTHSLKCPNDLIIGTSEKHLARICKHQNEPMRNIISIEYIGDEECQCIMVDHPDHTYISDGFIPTHNTTIAKIIANEINEGKGEPIELDAASHGSTEEIRMITSQAATFPVGMKYKIFIIDECHALSNTAWQVFLKTLEEQPAKSIFIFATTNPEKIPATILSRVQTFKLSKISTKGIQNRLKYVIEQENKEGQGITYDEDALNYIARLSNGGMRDSLTNLDRCLAFSKNITLENVSEALDLPDYDTYFELLNSLVKKDNEGTTKIVDEVYNSGTNFVKWFEGFHSFLCNIVKFVYMKDIRATMIPSQYAEKLSSYSEQHAVICLKLSNVLLHLNKDLRTTQYQVETAMTYLLSSAKK